MIKHGVRFKPEQIVSQLRQIEVLTANGKSLGKQLNPVPLRCAALLGAVRRI
jgi:hypothetical protein